MPAQTRVDDDLMVVAGYGKLPQGTGAEQLHKVLALVVKVDRRSGRVVDASSTLIARVADEFVCNALIGKSLTTDAGECIDFLLSHYHGLAQRAVIAAFRDMVRRYVETTSGETGSSAEGAVHDGENGIR